MASKLGCFFLPIFFLSSPRFLTGFHRLERRRLCELSWRCVLIYFFSLLSNSHIRSLLIVRAANTAAAFSLPTLAAVLSFVVYNLSGHPIDPAVIFTSLTLFQLLRMPLMFLRESYIRLYTSPSYFTREHFGSNVCQCYCRCH